MDSQGFVSVIDALRKQVAPLRSAADPRALTPAMTEALATLERAVEALQASYDSGDPPLAGSGGDGLAAKTPRREWHELVEPAPDAYLLTDLAGVILDANRVAVNLFGVPREALVGASLAVFLPLEERRNFAVRILRPPAPGERREIEMRLAPRPGHELAAQVTLARLGPFTSGQTDITWIIHDITLRQRVEEALRAALETVRLGEERLDTALRLAPVTVLTTDRRLHHTLLHGPHLNPAVEALLATGTNHVPPPEGIVQLLAFEQVVLDGGVGARGEAPLFGAASEVVYYDVTADLLRDAAGEVAGLTVLLWDATERRLATEALRQARAELVEEVGRLESAMRQSAIDLESSRRKARELSRRLVEIQEQERRAIARELHDEAGQVLTALIMGLGAVEKEASQSEAVLSRVADLKRMADGALQALHQVAMQLRPVSLDRVGLVPAVEQQVASLKQQANLECDVVAVGMEGARLPADQETAIYRVVQEALTNVVRHAAAQHISVVLERRGEMVQAIIEDDGVGFDADAAIQKGRLGLLGMRERVEMLGGTLVIESSPGRGTAIFAEVPCDC